MVLQMFQDESDGGMTEIRFVPDDKSQLDRMFAIMSECQVYVNIINLEKKNIKKRKLWNFHNWEGVRAVSVSNLLLLS